MRIRTSGKNGEKECIWQETPWEQRSYFHANIHPQSPAGLSVVGLSVDALSQIPSLPPCLWINGLLCGHCSSLSMCGSPLLAGFWAGFGFYSWGRCWIGRAFQGGSSEESLGAWAEAEAGVRSLWADRELVCSHFCSGRGATVLSDAVGVLSVPSVLSPEARCPPASRTGLGLPQELRLGSRMQT